MAREFAGVAARLGYPGLTVTERQIQRWESPAPPTPRPAQARVLEALFSCSLAELGWEHMRGPAGIDEAGEWTPTSSVTLLGSITGPPEAHRHDGILSGSALAAFAFRYFSVEDSPLAVDLLDGKRRVADDDLAALRASLLRLRALDARLGSRSIVSPVRGLCRGVFDLLRDGHFTDAVGRDLWRLGADAAGFAGWILFDCGEDAEAQRYLRFSLRAARHADDDVLAAMTLGFMTIQKYNLCEWDDATMLANAARRLLRGHDCPYLTASLMTRQARAAAGKGDEGRCSGYLEEALEQHRCGPGDSHPDTVDWVTLGEIHGQAAGCAALLGRPVRADEEFAQARESYGPGAHRSSSLHALRVALSHAQSGGIERACELTSEALVLGREVRSYRFEEAKGDLVASMGGHAASRPVRALREHHPELFLRRLPRSRLSLRREDDVPVSPPRPLG